MCVPQCCLILHEKTTQSKGNLALDHNAASQTFLVLAENHVPKILPWQNRIINTNVAVADVVVATLRVFKKTRNKQSLTNLNKHIAWAPSGLQRNTITKVFL